MGQDTMRDSAAQSKAKEIAMKGGWDMSWLLDPEDEELVASWRGGFKNEFWSEYVDGDLREHWSKYTDEELRLGAIEDLERYLVAGKEQARAYLTATGSLRDSAAQLAQVQAEPYVFPSYIPNKLQPYRERVGWDPFLTRCSIVLGMRMQGREIRKYVASSRLTQELLKTDLPIRDVLDVMGGMYDFAYPEFNKVQLEENVQKLINNTDRLEELCQAVTGSCAFGRAIAIRALNEKTGAPGAQAAQAKAGILAGAGDSSQRVQKVLRECLCAHPDWAPDVAALLKSKKAAARCVAATVAGTLGTLRPQLEQALAAEKSAKVAKVISEALGKPVGATVLVSPPDDPEELAARVLKGGQRRRIQWLLDTALPALHTEQGEAVSEDRRDAILAAYCAVGDVGRCQEADTLARGLDQKDLADLADAVYEAWLAADAPIKAKWVLAAAAILGGETMTAKLSQSVEEWGYRFRGALACDVMNALALSRDTAALEALDELSLKAEFPQIRNGAVAALQSAADERGLSLEELLDELVPALGFSAQGVRVFDYGRRRLIVRLDAALELSFETEAGKTLKKMPSPGKTDDPEKAAASYEAYKGLKKKIRAVVARQRSRLRAAFASGRCWNAETWQRLFVHNSLMRPFVLSLIWGTYEDGRLVTAFRYMEDGSFTTVEEEEYTLPEGARVGLAHPVELGEEACAAWKRQLADYEIIPAFPQLSRHAYPLPEGIGACRRLETFGGKILNGRSLSNRLRGMGWSRGETDEDGEYNCFYREEPAQGLGIVLRISGNSIWDEDETVTVYDGAFYRTGGAGKPGEPEEDRILALGQLPARYYSEAIYQLTRATAPSIETDPDWKDR